MGFLRLSGEEEEEEEERGGGVRPKRKREAMNNFLFSPTHSCRLSWEKWESCRKLPPPILWATLLSAPLNQRNAEACDGVVSFSFGVVVVLCCTSVSQISIAPFFFFEENGCDHDRKWKKKSTLKSGAKKYFLSRIATYTSSTALARSKFCSTRATKNGL